MSEIFEIDTTPGDDLGRAVSEEWIAQVHQSLIGMQVSLDPDPLETGPQALNEKATQCKNYMDEIDAINNRLISLMRLLDDEKTRVRADYRAIEDDLIANDPVIRVRKSIRDREAVVRYRLKTHIAYMTKLDRIGLALTSLDKLLSEKSALMKSTIQTINMQHRICQNDLGTGRNWFSPLSDKGKLDLSRVPRVPQPEAPLFGKAPEVHLPTLESLEIERETTKSIKELEQKYKEPSKTEEVVSDLETTSSEDSLDTFLKDSESEQEVEDFLAGLDDEVEDPKAPELDLDDILSGL